MYVTDGGYTNGWDRITNIHRQSKIMQLEFKNITNVHAWTYLEVYSIIFSTYLIFSTENGNLIKLSIIMCQKEEKEPWILLPIKSMSVSE
jgi:hypothetical protein